MTAADRRTRFLLFIGFLALAAGVLIAHRTPVDGYELDLYGATPLGYWFGVGGALVLSILVAVWAGSTKYTKSAASLLAGLAVLSVFALPLIRGYYFYGAGDALTHLGWTRELYAGSLSPFSLLYPGVHSAALTTGVLTGRTLSFSLMAVSLVAFPLVFLLAITLCVELFSDSELAPQIGLLSALLLLPINNVSVHPATHPTSQAILFAPFVLYVGLRYAVTRAGDGDSVSRGGFLGLFALAAAGTVLIHPQQALNVVAVFFAVVAVQVAARRLRPSHPVASHNSLGLFTGVLVALFLLWTPRHPRASGATVSVLESIIFQGPTAGEVVGSKSVSLLALGGSVVSLAVKLFLPSLLFVVLAGGLAFAVLRGRAGQTHRSALLSYLVWALAPLTIAFGIFYVSSSGDQYFRYQGFIMVLVTVLGATALLAGFQWLQSRDRGRLAGAGTIVVFVVLAALAIPALHPSPYMYQPSSHVPESHVDGYANAFEHRASGVPFTGLRGGPQRYVDAHYGAQRARFRMDFPGYESGVPRRVFNNASYDSFFDQDRYLAVTERNRRTELQLYNGLRYDKAGFRALETTPGVERVRSNGGFSLYFLDEAEAPATSQATGGTETAGATGATQATGANETTPVTEGPETPEPTTTPGGTETTAAPEPAQTAEGAETPDESEPTETPETPQETETPTQTPTTTSEPTATTTSEPPTTESSEPTDTTQTPDPTETTETPEPTTTTTTTGAIGLTDLTEATGVTEVIELDGEGNETDDGGPT